MAFFCSICVEVFMPVSAGVNNIVSTKCGHVFHSSCLTTWLLQKKSCPTCRKGVTQDDSIRLFLDVSGDESKLDSNDVFVLKSQVESLKWELDQSLRSRENMKVEIEQKLKTINLLKNKIKKFNQKCEITEENLMLAKDTIKHLANEKRELSEKLAKANCSIQELERKVNIDLLLNGTSWNNEMIDNVSSDDCKQLIPFFKKKLIDTQKELQRCELNRNQLNKKNFSLQKSLEEVQNQLKELNEVLKLYQENISFQRGMNDANSFSLNHSTSELVVSNDSSHTSAESFSPSAKSFSRENCMSSSNSNRRFTIMSTTPFPDRTRKRSPPKLATKIRILTKRRL